MWGTNAYAGPALAHINKNLKIIKINNKIKMELCMNPEVARSLRAELWKMLATGIYVLLVFISLLEI